MRTAVGILITTACALLGACSSADVEPDPSCTQPPPTRRVALADFVFEPACIGAAPGATLDLDNTGAAPHTFTVEGTPVDVNVAAGESARVRLTEVEPGAYAVTCVYHPQMIGTLVVPG